MNYAFLSGFLVPNSKQMKGRTISDKYKYDRNLHNKPLDSTLTTERIRIRRTKREREN
jgi:hypothetical protein